MTWMGIWSSKALEAKITELIDRAKLPQLTFDDIDRYLGRAVSILRDTLVLAPTESYEILNTSTPVPERIDGYLDLSKMKVGDQIRIEFLVRMSQDEDPIMFETYELGAQEKPAMRLSALLAPAGVMIRTSHLAGNRFQIGYFFVRRRDE